MKVYHNKIILICLFIYFFKLIIIINTNILVCNYKCNSCVDRNDKCTSCSDVNRIDDEVCNCKPGWFEDPSTKNCLECDP